MAVDKIVDLINAKLDREMTLFNFEFEKILLEIKKLVQIRAVELYKYPLKFDFAFQQILHDTGYYDLVNKFIDNSYDKTYGEIIALFKAGGLTVAFSVEDLEAIRAIKSLDLDFFSQIGLNASQSLKADLYKYSLSDISKKDIIGNISKSLEDTDLARYSKTYAETAISNFNQSVIDLKSAGVTGEVYVYVGVRDKKTRSFCRCVLNHNKYYDKSNASRLKTDKRRAYNCRHIILPISLKDAKDDGYVQGSFSC